MQKTAYGSLCFPGWDLPWPGKKRSITKTLLVMKLTALLLTVTFLQAYAVGSAQSVTISGKDIPLKQVFSAIKQQTGYVVFYNQEMLSGTKPVSLSVFKMPLNDLLTVVFAEQPVNFLIQDKTIILSRRIAAGKAHSPDEGIAEEPGIQVGGMIRSEDGEFLQGVSIRIKKTGAGTTTNQAGTFVLKLVPENAVLEISMVGYEKVSMTLVRSGEKFRLTTAAKTLYSGEHYTPEGMLFLNLTMKKSLSTLDETQVIAYGRTSKRFSTGSIGTVKGEDIERQPVMNVLQALEGRVPGLNIESTTGNAAAPIKVEIRGRNSLNPNMISEPLYIVDGVPQGVFSTGSYAQTSVNTGFVQAGQTNTDGESPLLYLNPRDIESIDVLKDADATAIYGARGANGVILITTKKGKPGPTRFNLNIDRGKITIPRRMKLLSTEEYLAVRREAFRNDGIKPDIYNAPDLMLWDQQKNTDWQELFFAPGERLSVNAGVSGGVAQTTYGVSASFQSQQELMNQGGKNIRGGLSGNVSHTSLNQKFHFSLQSLLSFMSVDAIRSDNYINTPPNAPDVYTEKGEFNFVPYRGQFGTIFPFTALKQPSESRTTVAANTLRLSYEIISGLKVSVGGGFNFSNNDNAFFRPSASMDPLFGNTSTATFGKSSTSNLLIEPQLQYTAFVGKGNLSVQLGSSLQVASNEGLTTFGMGFSNDNLMRSPNNALLKILTEGSSNYRYNAAFAIINYRWADKYIINLNARRDGSSRFGPGKQFGNFGSVGLAWIATEEKWMKSFLPSWWSFIKLRGSYGVTGSDNVGDYEYLTRWGGAMQQNSPDNIYDYNGTPGFHLMNPVNPDFRWESTTKAEASMSLGFLDDRINLEVAYYRNRSGNQLMQVGTPLYTGFGHVRVNWPALVENSGIEMSLGARIVQKKDWQISANFNIGMNKNKLVDFPGLESSPYADNYVVGQSLNMKYLFHYIGINPVNGDYVFEDHNKDGVVSFANSTIPQSSADDRYVVYDLNPDYVGGFGLQVAYKGFSLYSNFTFKKQLKQDPYYDLNIGAMSNLIIPKEVADNRWRNPGDNALYPKYTTQALNYNMSNSDRVYSDGSYLKMTSLSLSYSLPAELLRKIKIQSCSFSISTQNLFTITSYRGIDPEVGSMLRGTPIPRTISSSLNFTF